MKRKSALAATALLMTLAFVLSAAGSISAANVVATVSVGTTPMSVAYNPTTNKIYVTNDGDSTLSVINGITDTVTSVSINSGNHSVAANPTTNKIYVANEAGNNVTVWMARPTRSSARPSRSGRHLWPSLSTQRPTESTWQMSRTTMYR